MTLSDEEHRQVKNLFQAWEARLKSQARQFDTLTSKALDVDAEITSSAEQVHALRLAQGELSAQLKLADSSVNQLWQQQDILEVLQKGLQEHLELGPLAKEGGASSDPGARADVRAARLGTQLEELTRQVRELAAETAAFQTSRYARPLDRVAHVLDAHSSELDLVQERLDCAERQLRDLALQ